MLPQNTLDILKNLTKNDLKKLGDLINSPYFNSKKSLNSLYKIIAKQHPDFKPEKFDNHKIYKKIYGNEEFKEQTIKNLYSDFGKLLKKFIAHERIESNEADFEDILIKGLNDKKCFELLSSLIPTYKKKRAEITNSEEDYYFNLYTLDMAFYHGLIALNKSNLNEHHKVINSMIDNLTNFFLCAFYFLAKQDSVLNKAHKVKKDLSEIKNNFLNAFDSEKFFELTKDKVEFTFIKIRYLCLKYLEGDVTEKEFYELEKLITSNVKSFSNPLKITCWGSLLTILILKFIPKDKKYYRESYRINDFFVKLNIYPNTDAPTISIALYRDNFGIALILNEFEWCKMFVDKFTQYLDEESKENEMNYALGRLSFKLNRYEESLEHLSKIKFQKVDEKLVVRFYYLMNYIELKSYQSAISMLNSIRQFFVTSKELPEMYAILIEDSLKFFKEIIRAEENNKKLDYAILKEAESAGRYFHKTYILEKIKKLI